MTYIVCNNCNGYYELQKEESQENFDLECECGGNLISVDVENKNTQSFSNIKEDYNELLGYLKNNRINFNYKKSEIPFHLDNDEKILLNFENIKLINPTSSNNEFEIDTGHLTLTNKKILFLGNKDPLNFGLGDIKTIKTFYNGFGIALNNEIELKEYLVGIDQMKIMMPLKAMRDKYSIQFNGEMANVMIEGAIKRYKDALESESIKNKNIENKKAKKQKKSAKKEGKPSEKLMNCPDCGHKISRKANKCPNCGNPIPQNFLKINEIIIKGTIIAMITGVISFISGIGMFIWIIGLIVGGYIGWVRNEESLGDAVGNGFYTALYSGTILGLLVFILSFSVALGIVILIAYMIFLIPGSVLGWIISSRLKPKQTNIPI